MTQLFTYFWSYMNLYLMEPSTVSMAIQGHLYHYWSDTLGRFPKVRTGRPDHGRTSQNEKAISFFQGFFAEKPSP